jgi:hypothetical protein
MIISGFGDGDADFGHPERRTACTSGVFFAQVMMAASCSSMTGDQQTL